MSDQDTEMAETRYATHEALGDVGPHFVMFSRNGRWGTCGDCPQDAAGNLHPEFCGNTDRYDHHLTAMNLAQTWSNHYMKWKDHARRLKNRT